MGIRISRGWIGRIAAGCVLSAWMGSGWAQSAADGAIGGRITDTAGVPVAGAVVAVEELDTGLVLRAVSGTKGEFLVARLPVGDYAVTVDDAGGELVLPDPVSVELGEVTEIEAQLRAALLGRPASPGGAGRSGSVVTEADLVALQAGGEWRSLARTQPGANDAGGDDDAGEVSFRGVAPSQNSSRSDGTSEDEAFSGSRVGAGGAEDADAGADEVADGAAGVGGGSRSVADGGQRAGSAYTFSQAAVREFRVAEQPTAAVYGAALYGHGVGGVVTAVSRSGGSKLHGMAFYTVRDSAWAAANPFSVASTYASGVVTSAVVKPLDLRQQFGGRIGGPLLEHSAAGVAASRLFYFYAFDAQRRNFPAISAPGYAGFYTLTATQEALLANRGVTPAKTMAALNYLDSLSGTVARRADQAVNFGRLDWDRASGSRVVLEYNRAR